jgi:hypothetical protein
MAISKTDIRDLVKRRLGLSLTDPVHDDLIDLYIDATEEAILNYCNIASVPDGLKQTWAAMAASALSAEQSAILYPNPNPVDLYETHIGDTTVKPVKQVAPPVPSLTVIESLVFDYRSSLHAYRRLRW